MVTKSKSTVKAKAKKPSIASLRKQIVGTWKLISAENKVNGKWTPYVFGNPPSGYFIYDATGRASIQIMTTPPQKVADPDNPTPAEALNIFNNYIAYYGTYTLDAVNITVKVEGALGSLAGRYRAGKAISAARQYADHWRPGNVHQNLEAR